MADLISIYSRAVVQVKALSATKVTLGAATGTLLSAAGKVFLLTNYHVLTGKDPYSDKMTGPARPDFLEVSYRTRVGNAEMPKLSPIQHSLYDADNNPLFTVLPENQRKLPIETSGLKLAIDIAALELPDVPHDFGFLPFERPQEFHVPVMERVGIIGFPFALTGTENFPIWLTGSVASDLANRPYRKYFLVDARTRPSCSGSLVVFNKSGASLHYPGGKADDRGNTVHTLGIYSGRVREESDIGIVWHWNTVEQLLEKMIPLEQQDWKSHAERTGKARKIPMRAPSRPA